MRHMKRLNSSRSLANTSSANKYITDALIAFKPPEKITVSEWADKYRVLDEKSSAAPGKWNTERTPYLRRIMNEFCNPEIEEIDFCAGSQIGKTEAEYNMMCFAIDQDPGPVLVVYPTDKLAKFASENRLQPMFRLSPATRDKYDERASDLLELQFTNNYIALIGANSPSNLATRPVRYVFFDEIDKYPKWSGEEANPISLAEERQKTFYNKKTVKVSTPTTKRGNIWQSYISADLKLKYHVPCPHCGHEQEFRFKQIKWPKEMDQPALIRYAAWYECENCHERIDDRYKMEMLRSGDWKPENIPFGRVKSVGFHLNSIYSPWLTFGDVAAKFVSVKDAPEDLMNFINSWLAEPWEDKAVSMKSDIVLAHATENEETYVPEEAMILTMGVDVQKGYFVWTVRAWGERLTSWNIAHGRADNWEDIEDILYRQWMCKTTGEIFNIAKAGIDSGYETDDVYAFCTYHQGIAVPTKGSSNPLRARYQISMIDKGVAAGLQLYIFDPVQYKDFIAGRLAKPVGIGSWMVYAGCDREYADQICAEQQIITKNKKGQEFRTWEKVASHAANHYLDAEVNAALAGDLVHIRYLQKQQAEPEQEQSNVSIPGAENWINAGENWMIRR